MQSMPQSLEGRPLRRLSGDQVRAALTELTGFVYIGSMLVDDPDAPTGESVRDDVDMLDHYGLTLGRPDYDYVVHENLEPGISFSKMTEDAARFTCGEAAEAEVMLQMPPAGVPRLLVDASPTDVLPAREAAIRKNLATLVMRFWGDAVTTDSDEVNALLEVFKAGATGPQEGWRLVCVALATHPRFYTY
jgi:hypothetical protein